MGPLHETFRWAEHLVAFVQSEGKGKWFLSSETVIPTSSWFSGYSCPEWACSMISSASCKLNKNTTSLAFLPMYQYEINAKARYSSARNLPTYTCQHIDIERLLPQDAINKLRDIEKTSSGVAKDTWEFLKSVTLLEGSQTCSRHLQNCPFQTSCLDISGSMCVHYSTMGKKVDGALLKKNGTSNKLLQIYVKYHCSRKTPLLIHENLQNFDSTELASLLAEGGYKYLCRINVCAADAGLAVNPRSRGCLGCPID